MTAGAKENEDEEYRNLEIPKSIRKQFPLSSMMFSYNIKNSKPDE